MIAQELLTMKLMKDMKNPLQGLLLAVVAVGVMVASTGAQERPAPPPGVASQSGRSRPISPTVVATTMTRTIDGNNSLDLMVLWRGTPEWYLKPGGRSGGGGSLGNQGTRYARVQYGGVELRVELLLQPRAVRIQDQAVSLSVPDANVVLVDEADGPNLKVVSTHKVDAVTKDPDIVPWLKQSPQISSFLQCHMKVSERARITVEPICQAVMQK